MLPEILTEIPGPASRELARRLQQVESRNVTYLGDDFPVFWSRATGVNVWDTDGNRYLDLTAGFGVCSLGHGATAGAMERQAAALIHGLGDVHPTEAKVELCEALSRITAGRWGTGKARTILCSSGSEAVEAALKTSLMYSGKAGVIAFSGGYHGLGHGALEASGLPFFRDPFASQLARFSDRLPFLDCQRCPHGRTEGYRLEGRTFPNCSSECLGILRDSLEQTARKRDIGCVLVEPIQGRAGVIVPPKDFLRVLRDFCDAHKILLVLDEIFTGFNRTGRLFACEHSEITPDIICMGKALANGFPISACVGRSDIMDAWPRSEGEALHTSTFLGHPVGCAMALESIAIHERAETAESVRKTGKALRAALETLASCRVRGVGLMLGAELVRTDGSPDAERASRAVTKALQSGVILLSGGPSNNVLTLTPPFGLSAEEIAYLGRLFSEI